MPNRNVGRCTHNVRVPVPPPRRVTAGRTARASVEVWSLTVLAHSVAGGALPSLPWLVGVAGLVTVSTAWVLRRSVRLAVMLPVLVLCQLGLHVLFASLSTPGAGTHHPQHAAAPSPWWMDELSPRMAAAHVLCAVLTGVVWWVRRSVVDMVLALAGRWWSRCGRPRSRQPRGRRSDRRGLAGRRPGPRTAVRRRLPESSRTARARARRP